MKYDPFSRRFFLQGLGGSMLMLPILPSLNKAYAQAASQDKFLILVGSYHGGTGVDDWYPTPVAQNPNAGVLSKQLLHQVGGPNNLDHEIRHGRLTQMLTAAPGHPGGNVDNGQARLSYTLGAFLNPYLNKMNLYRGIDGGMFTSGHSNGIYSGNLKAAVNATTDDLEHWPSLDRFLANYNGFYPDRSQISVDVFNRANFSYLANGDNIPTSGFRIEQYYDQLFNKYQTTTDPAVIAKRQKKEYLLDRVLGDYNRFINGAHGPSRKLSSVDKRRVEEHVEKLHNLQKQTKSTVNSCSDVTGPKSTLRESGSSLTELETYYDMVAELIAASFKCGATKLATLQLRTNGITYAGNYHQDVVHQCTTDPAMQLIHNTTFRWQAQHVITKLLEKLEGQTLAGQSGTLLDNSLVQWTHECGYITHGHDSIGCISFGSLGGHFNTGNYIDYRNIQNMGLKVWSNTSDARPGIPIQRYWANILHGFGVQNSAFERHGKKGFGDTSRNDFPRGLPSNNLGHIAYPDRVLQDLSKPLPVVRS